MRVLLASGLAYFPQATGGSQAAMHDLAIELKARNIEVAVLASLANEGLVALRSRVLMKALRKSYARDDRYGYPVFRKWDARANLGDLVSDFMPDVVVAHPVGQVKLAEEFLKLSVPTVVYLHDVLFKELGGDPRALPKATFVSNSRFTARRFRELFGLESAVVPPIFVPERYTGPHRSSNVTFINPHPDKGLEIALEIAKQCQDIPFRFQESWPLRGALKQHVLDEAQAAGNISLKSPTRDIKSVYADTKILLVPSRCEEAWGRVVSEAQYNGIPVLASNIGGLPEAVGPGGILVDPEASVDFWVEKLRRLWTDGSHYKDVSEAAFAHSRRPELDRGTQVAALIASLQQATKGNILQR